MWTRAQLKDNAKSALKPTYWLSFVVCILPTAIAGIFFYIIFSFLGLGQMATSYSYSYNYSYSYGYSLNAGGTFISFLLLILASIFLLSPLIVGSARFFIRAAQGDCQITYLFSVFEKKNYMNIVKVMFMQSLYVFLWSLLFVVPGIIKSYQYYMVPYLLAENPEMNYKDALALSTAMTNGEKMNIFVLELSFLGWAMLGSMLCYVGNLFLYPYMNATYAQLYFALKAKMSGGYYQPQYASGYNGGSSYPNYTVQQDPYANVNGYPPQQPQSPQPPYPNYNAQPSMPTTPDQPPYPNYNNVQPPVAPTESTPPQNNEPPIQ